MQLTYLIILIHASISNSLSCPTSWMEDNSGNNFSHFPLISSQFWDEKNIYEPQKNIYIWTPLIFISFLRCFHSHLLSKISIFHSFHSYPHFHPKRMSLSLLISCSSYNLAYQSMNRNYFLHPQPHLITPNNSQIWPKYLDVLV